MKLAEVLGQKVAKEHIVRMVDNDTIPHAIMLYGEPGIPKLSLARAMAQYIHCENRQNGDSCGVCASCIQHQTFNHGDTYFSYPIVKKKSVDAKLACSDDYSREWVEFLATNPLVEDYEKWLEAMKSENAQPIMYVGESASIVHKMSLSSMTSKYKILIMWLPEKMNVNCANKLLKLIEEPSSDSLFIFVSNNANDVLPTIYSRTQRIELKRLALDEVASYIQEKYGLSEQDALSIASTSEGNVLQAEMNLAYESENKDFFKDFIQLMRLAYSRDLKQLKAWSERVFNYKREKIRRFLVYSSRMLRENFIYNLGESKLNYMTKQEEEFSVKFSPFINEVNVIKMLDEFNKAEIDIAGNGNGKIILFDLAIRITILIKR